MLAASPVNDSGRTGRAPIPLTASGTITIAVAPRRANRNGARGAKNAHSPASPEPPSMSTSL
ncbi:hypothetical protein [Actinophytocola sp.]|uniref:hypothetical protein n=1 Tax=Actinophytocola sp. TaxID=1872138 RepID=UPI0025C201B1|nr:hypothetical protein [Actinophytocola sp.]